MSDKSDTALATVNSAALIAALANPINAESAKREEGESPVNFPAYVGFRGAKAEKNLDALDAAGIQVDQFYLKDGGEFLPLVPCDVHVLKAVKFFTLEKDGELLGVSFTDSDEQFKQGYRPHIHAVVAVRLKGSVYVPATLILRGGQAKALSTALIAIDPSKNGQACDPKVWAARGQRHADSAGAKLPGLRFYVRIVSEREKGESGRTYNEGHGTIVPTAKDDVPLINDWFDKDQARIASALAVHEKRLASARDFANGGKIGE